MPPKKVRHTSRKRAAYNGGGRRPPPKLHAQPPAPIGAESAHANISDSDDSELCVSMASKAAKLSTAASPRDSSRASSPPGRSAPPESVELETQLRRSRKTLREIEGLMHRPVATLDRQAQAKLLRFGEVTHEVDRLETALAATLRAPEEAEADVSSAACSAESEEDDDADGATTAERYRDHGECSSEAGSVSSSTGASRLSLGSVVSATAHQPSEFYEEPAPPTPPQPPPALRRSDVAAGTSTEEAYAERERWVRQVQAIKPTVAEVEPASPRAQRVLRAQGQRAQDGIVAY